MQAICRTLSFQTQVLLSFLLAANLSCTTTYKPTVDNSPGRPTTYGDAGSPGKASGIGIESQDIVSMTDKMMRDMLANPILGASATPPKVIIDAAFFKNEGSQRINKNLIADRLREGLFKAANGRMVFVARHATDMVEQERELKNQGVVDQGTIPSSSTTAGADYRLFGRIADQNKIDPRTGLTSRYIQITFEMINLDKGTIVWGGMYEFLKTAQDDIVYREPTV